MTNLTCPLCGYEVDSENVHCPDCGADVTLDKQEAWEELLVRRGPPSCVLSSRPAPTPEWLWRWRISTALPGLIVPVWVLATLGSSGSEAGFDVAWALLKIADVVVLVALALSLALPRRLIPGRAVTISLMPLLLAVSALIVVPITFAVGATLESTGIAGLVLCVVYPPALVAGRLAWQRRVGAADLRSSTVRQGPRGRRLVLLSRTALVAALLAVVGLLAAAATVSGVWASTPSDDDLIDNLNNHKRDFDQLLRMLAEDEGLEMIGHDWARPGLRAAGVSKARLRHYRKLMRRAGIDGDIQRDEATAWFRVAYAGDVFSSDDRGYVYSAKPLSPLFDSLDGTEAVGRTAYRDIGSSWYLYRWIDP